MSYTAAEIFKLSIVIPPRTDGHGKNNHLSRYGLTGPRNSGSP